MGNFTSSFSETSTGQTPQESSFSVGESTPRTSPEKPSNSTPVTPDPRTRVSENFDEEADALKRKIDFSVDAPVKIKTCKLCGIQKARGEHHDPQVCGVEQIRTHIEFLRTATVLQTSPSTLANVKDLNFPHLIRDGCQSRPVSILLLILRDLANDESDSFTENLTGRLFFYSVFLNVLCTYEESVRNFTKNQVALDSVATRPAGFSTGRVEKETDPEVCYLCCEPLSECETELSSVSAEIFQMLREHLPNPIRVAPVLSHLSLDIINVLTEEVNRCPDEYLARMLFETEIHYYLFLCEEARMTMLNDLFQDTIRRE